MPGMNSQPVDWSELAAVLVTGIISNRDLVIAALASAWACSTRIAQEAA